MLSYYQAIWDTYSIGLKDTDKEEATPESLRAAAKVLEDKAKELEKPKLTKEIEDVLAYCDEVGINVVTGCGAYKYKHVESDKHDSDYGKAWGRSFEFHTTIRSGYHYIGDIAYKYLVAKEYSHDPAEMYIVIDL